MRNVFGKLFILFSLVLTACGSQNFNATSSSQLSGGQITSMTYQVQGGGDIQYMITNSGYGAFMVMVQRYRGQQRNQTIALQQNSPSYSFVMALFQRQVEVTTAGAAPSGYMGGSWSQLSLSAGNNSITIQSPVVNGSTSQFDMLYQTIASQL